MCVYVCIIYIYIYIYCIAADKYGETKCVSDMDCISLEAGCMGGVCKCKSGDEYASEDKTACYRKNEIKNMITISCSHALMYIHRVLYA